MTARLVGATLICVCLILLTAGCGLEVFDRTPREIAALRKAGNLQGAREKALSVLSNKPGRMAVWRELAATDVALVKNSESDTNSLSELIEAALICSAMNGHEKEKLDFEWQRVGMVTFVEVENDANRLAAYFDVTQAPRRSDPEPREMRGNIPDGETQTHIHYESSGRSRDVDMRGASPQEIGEVFRKIMQEAHEAPDRYYEPAAIGDVVRQLSTLMALLERLPCDDPRQAAVALNKLERKLLSAANNSNISADFISTRRSAASDAVAEALSAAEADLKSEDHFQPATIFQNKVLD